MAATTQSIPRKIWQTLARSKPASSFSFWWLFSRLRERLFCNVPRPILRDVAGVLPRVLRLLDA